MPGLRDNPRLTYGLVNLATLLWASNIALGRALRGMIGPVTLTVTRFAVAVLVFAIIIQYSNRRSGPGPPASAEKRIWVWIGGMAITGVFGFPVLLYLALQQTTATNAALINASGPLITLLLAAAFLRERITTRLIVGAVVSLTGVGLIIANGQSLSELAFNRGDLIALGAAALWGCYSIFARLATRSHPTIWVTARSIWIGLPLLLPLLAYEWRVAPLDLSLPIILASIYIGIFPTVIAMLAWNEGVRLLGPNQAMAFYNTLPVYGTLLGVLLLGEALTWQSVIGGALVVAGGLVVAGSRKTS